MERKPMKSSVKSSEVSQSSERIGKRPLRDKNGTLVAIGVMFNPNGQTDPPSPVSLTKSPVPASK